MAKAADKTIAFVKEWIEGKLTKRQYMHYYIVKTKDAEFLMKANEKPDLVAIKDKSGHVYIPDDTLHCYGLREERTLRNPLFALLADRFQFPHSLLEEGSFQEGVGAEVSKWKTLDRIEVLNNNAEMNVYVSLVQMGEKRYVTDTSFRDNTRMDLREWADYGDLKKKVFKDYNKIDKIQPYTRLREIAGKPTKVAEVRGAYVEYAGSLASEAIVGEEWIYIPTHKAKLNEVADENIPAVLKTRPLPYHYGLTSDVINVEKAWQRTEFPFYPEQLSNYHSAENFINLNNLPNGRAFIHSGHQWREWLRAGIEAEIAESLIQFIDDDDAWLSDNGYVMSAFAWGRKFKADLFKEALNGYLLVVEESNPSLCSRHVAYVKGSTLDTYNGKVRITMPFFTKIIPAPHNPHKRDIEEFTTYVCG